MFRLESWAQLTGGRSRHEIRYGLTSLPASVASPERLLALVQRDGRVYLSGAEIDGRFALRACITNYRTTPADIERALEVVRELASR